MQKMLAPFLGVNKDLSIADLKDGFVTDASNVRFRESYAELFLGQVEAYTTAPIAPITAFPVRIAGARYWLVLSQTKAYAVTGIPAVWTNVTRQTASVDVNYAATLDTLWNGGVLNGIPIVNNGVDVPQMWLPAGTGTKLQALSNWPASTTARVLRMHQNFAFALDVTESGTRRPHLLKWSAPAEPGTVPVTWDENDGTNDAGERDIPGNGYLVDGLSLRQSFIIYKEGSTHIASYAGSPFIWNTQQLFATSGMLSADCAVEIDGTHVVLTSSDVVRHDGSNVQSIVDKATRRWPARPMCSTFYIGCWMANRPCYR